MVLAGGGRVIGVVGEDLKQAATDDRRALGHRSQEVGVADGGDRQVGEQDEEAPGSGLEQRPEVWAC